MKIRLYTAPSKFHDFSIFQAISPEWLSKWLSKTIYVNWCQRSQTAIVFLINNPISCPDPFFHFSPPPSLLLSSQ